MGDDTSTTVKALEEATAPATTGHPELPALTVDPDWLDEAKEAAEEVQAWLLIPNEDELATAIEWYRRLGLCLSEFVGPNEALQERLAQRETMADHPHVEFRR